MFITYVGPNWHKLIATFAVAHSHVGADVELNCCDEQLMAGKDDGGSLERLPPLWMLLGRKISLSSGCLASTLSISVKSSWLDRMSSLE